MADSSCFEGDLYTTVYCIYNTYDQKCGKYSLLLLLVILQCYLFVTLVLFFLMACINSINVLQHFQVFCGVYACFDVCQIVSFCLALDMHYVVIILFCLRPSGSGKQVRTLSSDQRFSDTSNDNNTLCAK